MFLDSSSLGANRVVSNLPMVSQHFGGAELTANQFGYKLDYVPPGVLERQRILAEELLEPFSKLLKGDLKVRNWYANPVLNSLLGRPSDSPFLNGEAIDLFVQKTPLRLAFEKLVRSKLDFDTATLNDYNETITVIYRSGDRRDLLPHRRLTYRRLRVGFELQPYR